MKLDYEWIIALTLVVLMVAIGTVFHQWNEHRYFLNCLDVSQNIEGCKTLFQYQ